MRIAARVVAVLLGLLTIATLLTLVPADAWWVRVVDFPRIQFLVLLLGLGALYLWLTHGRESDHPRARMVVLGLTVVSVAYQAATVVPYLPVYPEQAKHARDLGVADTTGVDSLSILVANVLMDNRSAQPTLDAVRRERPDIVLLLEPDAWWAEQMTPIHDEYPHRIARPIDNTYGLLFYSRLPFEPVQIDTLMERGVPSVHVRLRLPSGRAAHFWGLHPKPPVPGEDDDSIERDAELMLVAKLVRDQPLPVVVAGDFNDVPWSQTSRQFKRVSRLLDPRIGRGLYATFPATRPFLRFPLDQVYPSDDFTVLSVERLEDIDSDHFPYLVRLKLTPGAKTQEEPEADSDDLQEADEQIEKGEAGG